MLEMIFLHMNTMIDSMKDYPMVQGAIITTFSMFVAGAVGFILVRLPRTIMNFFRTQLTTSLNFNTASVSWGEYNQRQYISLLKWYSNNYWFKWSRAITFDGASSSSANSVGPGVGSHPFFFGFRPFMMTISEITANQSQQSKYNIRITTIGRNQEPIRKLMKEFMVEEEKNRIRVYESNGRDWNYITNIKGRTLDSVVVKDNVQTELLDKITSFNKDEDWYISRGQDYKFCALLEGPPGTGKSSLLRAIASSLGRDIHILRPNSGANYFSLLQQAKGGVVIIEDIDAYDITNSRSDNSDAPLSDETSPAKPQVIAVPSFESMMDTNTLSELLNALQGVVGLQNVVILMTTNHIEKLDPALIRDSRVDVRVNVGLLEDKEVRKMIGILYPQKEIPEGIVFDEVAGATVQNKFIINKDDFCSFINSLPKK